jgi:hypothetical protein
MSIVNQQCAKIVLRSVDLPAGNNTLTAVYNTAGWCLNGRTTCGWSNINMRDVLGEMYDQYDLFNIILVDNASSYGNNLMGASTDDRFVKVYMSGLPWRNQGYSSALKCSTNSCLVGNINFVYGASSINRSSIPNVSTFSKQDGTTDIVITLLRQLDNAQPTYGDRDFNFSYTFNIYGVESSKVKQQDTIQHNNFYNK